VYSERREGGDAMITRKHLLLAIATTCLVTMFLITTVPIFSQTAGQYNPFLDVNHDGKIDIRDIALEAKAFGTAGDPTENVIVTLNTSEVMEGPITIPNQTTVEYLYNLTGFRQVSISINNPISNNVSADVAIGRWVGQQAYAMFNHISGGWIPLPTSQFYSQTALVSGPQLIILLWNTSPQNATYVYVDVFMTA
jgi:hypothetical protein